MKPVLDENVIGRNHFWMKVFLDEFFFAIWMNMYLTNSIRSSLMTSPLLRFVLACNYTPPSSPLPYHMQKLFHKVQWVIMIMK